MDDHKITFIITDKIIDKNASKKNEGLICPDGYESDTEIITLQLPETKELVVTEPQIETDSPYSPTITLGGVKYWNFSIDDYFKEYLANIFD